MDIKGRFLWELLSRIYYGCTRREVKIIPACRLDIFLRLDFYGNLLYWLGGYSLWGSREYFHGKDNESHIETVAECTNCVCGVC